MKKFLATAFGIIIGLSTFAQSTGDTIVVKSLHYGSATRDTTVSFPNDPSLTFSKVLMKYSMRCKDGKVSDGQNRNRGCGEWDYSCNTYIHDPSKIDSLYSRQISHVISNFSGSSFDYSQNPTYSYYLNYQQDVNVDSIISETLSSVGTGTVNMTECLPTSKLNAKSQYLYLASELSTAGVISGFIDGIMLNVSNTGGQANYLRVRIKSTTDTILSEITPDPEFVGFSEVYFYNTNLSNGLNRIQFHTAYNWNGTDNLIVELSFSNATSSSNTEVLGHTTSFEQGMHTSSDNYFFMDGANYIEANQYKGIGGSGARTVEAWIKTNQGGKEIVSWGRDASGQKWNFRVENSGELRVEVNGGNKVGLTKVNDGKWHHVACTFSGNNVTQVKLYVDGVLDGTKGQASKAINTDNSNGINVRISRGTNNRYFYGVIDDVRIWDTEIGQSEIEDWMNKSVNSNHPNYNNLKAWYSMNEGSGISIGDSTSNNNDASIELGNQWSKIKGVDLFKDVQYVQTRPNLTFLQGNYVLTTNTDTVIDTIQNFQHSVRAYTVHKMSGLKSDSISNTLSYYWPGGYEYLFDTNGIAVDSFQVSNSGSIAPVYLPYYRRYPMRFELVSFVTPYGIGLDFGLDGETWVFDITDFSPILTGDKRMTMEWGGQWQEEMDIQFEFIVGTPPRDVIDIEQIWRVTKPSYNSISNELDFRPRDVPMLSTGQSFKIRSAITGHGQEGEFIARDHFIDVNDGSLKEQWSVWKECAANPVHPQGGTWIYDRAGWCPGMATDLREIDITSKVTAGSTAKIDYGVVFASGASNYIVNNQLVTYGSTNFSLDASIVEIQSPTTSVAYAKRNQSCMNPTIVIKNTGSTDLTSVDIEYWINDATEKQSYTWTGNLEFNEEETVVLPSVGSNLWKNMKPDNNRFYAELSNPNEGNDEYIYNNSMRSHFEIPTVLPGQFVIWFKTNNAANENKYFVYDEHDQVIYSKTSFANNTEYRDTLTLGHGCYRLVLEDTDDDGISFWANNDGTGFMRLTEAAGSFGKIIETLQPDFGKFIEIQFTIDNPLVVEEIYNLKNDIFNIYPNPASSEFTVELNNLDNKTVNLLNSSGQMVGVTPNRQGNKLIFNSENLTKGIYLIQVFDGQNLNTKKVVIN